LFYMRSGIAYPHWIYGALPLDKNKLIRGFPQVGYPRAIQRTSVYASAEMAAAQGMVRIQAHTIRPATPQRTAESLRSEPTPIIEPVIV